jgi:hypothetical protein
MRDLWTAQIRVDALLAERTREADVERLVNFGEKASPTLSARLAGALRSAADLLDAAPDERRRSGIVQG